ncbi:MAG: TetR/AcrR family transcriptional regulator [Acidobacteria bacterium]|nr:TetR/AcrR family transcriptional regulator [Acidobacteriota bacterium]
MGIAERRARQKEALRSRILDAAGQLFVEEGFANVSLRKIAERIEYSPATIYLYFRDKHHLLTSLCGDTFAQLKTELERLENEERDALEGLRKGLRFYIDFGLEHPNHYLMTFCTPHEFYHQAASTPEFQHTNKIGLETFDCLRRALRRCRDQGLLEFEDLEATSQVAWTFIHGLTSLLILYYDDPHFPWVGRDRLIETGLDQILNGLRATAPVAS